MSYYQRPSRKEALVAFTAKPRFKKIGILGGMGPEATAEFYLKLIKAFQKDFGCVYDEDFPEILIYSLPIPDVVSSSANGKAVESALLAGVKKLKAAGVDFVAIPCNTVSIFIDSLREKTGMRIISVVEETIKEVEESSLKRVGLVGTRNTIDRGLFNRAGLDIIMPSEQEKDDITKIIINVLKGEKKRSDRRKLREIIDRLLARGAEKVILGCTELPLLLKGNPSTIDTIDVLMRSVIKEAEIS